MHNNDFPIAETLYTIMHTIQFLYSHSGKNLCRNMMSENRQYSLASSETRFPVHYKISRFHYNVILGPPPQRCKQRAPPKRVNLTTGQHFTFKRTNPQVERNTLENRGTNTKSKHTKATCSYFYNA